MTIRVHKTYAYTLGTLAGPRVHKTYAYALFALQVIKTHKVYAYALFEEIPAPPSGGRRRMSLM